MVTKGAAGDAFEALGEVGVQLHGREGAQSGRVMAIALHPYLTGVPHRIGAFEKALAYICGHERVWKATGAEIARHYLAQVAR